MMNFVFKTRNFALQLMDFAGGGVDVQAGGGASADTWVGAAPGA